MKQKALTMVTMVIYVQVLYNKILIKKNISDNRKKHTKVSLQDSSWSWRGGNVPPVMLAPLTLTEYSST